RWKRPSDFPILYSALTPQLGNRPYVRVLPGEERFQYGVRGFILHPTIRERVAQLLERPIAKEQLQEGQVRECRRAALVRRWRPLLPRLQAAMVERQPQAAAIEAEFRLTAIPCEHRHGQPPFERWRDVPDEAWQIGDAEIPGIDSTRVW